MSEYSREYYNVLMVDGPDIEKEKLWRQTDYHYSPGDEERPSLCPFFFSRFDGEKETAKVDLEIVIPGSEVFVFDSVRCEIDKNRVLFFTNELPVGAMKRLSSDFPTLSFKLFYLVVHVANAGIMLAQAGHITCHRLKKDITEEDDFRDEGLYAEEADLA
jgi:hypothetical protein